jgi:hypothetical protein
MVTPLDSLPPPFLIFFCFVASRFFALVDTHQVRYARFYVSLPCADTMDRSHEHKGLV